MNTILSRISSAISALRGQSATITSQAATQLLDTKVGHRSARIHVAATKSTAPGDFGSDGVADLAWQSQEAVINGGLWFAMSKLIRSLKANDPLAAEEAVNDLVAWNFSAQKFSAVGKPVPNKSDELLLDLLSKVLTGNNKDLTIVPDNVLTVLARVAKVPFEQYKAEHLTTVEDANNKVSDLLLSAQEHVVGHLSAEGCIEAFMPAKTAIDKITHQMTWMAKSWKDKALVAAEITLMEDDIKHLETLAKREAGRFQKYTEGTLSADGLEVYEALKKSQREVDAARDESYEPDAMQEAYKQRDEEELDNQIKRARQRIRKAA